jgi:hypothetical protein
VKNLVPNAVFEQHIIVLGKTRSGKSSVMRLFVEDLLAHEKPVCIIDPKGDWWGLKASADGKKAGFPVVIFGGTHADVPLNSRSGAAVAELVATGNRPSIIDLGGWMPGERTQFYIDFASAFFMKTRGRRWLVIDEVHNFCPKGKIMDPQAGKMLHWSNRLASEGLGKGVALIAASQRPQKVHNDFLTSCETLVAMRVIHPSDREAISDWIDGCADPKMAAEVLSSLASMKRGEGWVWSPEAEFGPKRIQFPMFETYDSFKARTSEETVKLKGWADVDLTDVTKKLEAVVKEAEAKDPGKLQARIRELEKQLRSAPIQKAQPTAANPKEIERAVKLAVAKRDQEIIKEINERNAAIRKLERCISEIHRATESAIRNGKIADRPLPKLPAFATALPTRVHKPISPEVEIRIPPHVARKESTNGDSGELTRPQQRVLAALAEFAGIGIETPSRGMVASWLGVKATTGSFKNYLSELRTRGLIADPAPERLRLTEEGLAKAPPVETAVSTEELLRRSESALGSTTGKILRIVHAAHPEFVSRQEIAEQLGISAETGSFKNYISELRVAGMIEDGPEKQLKAADWLFIG